MELEAKEIDQRTKQDTGAGTTTALVAGEDRVPALPRLLKALCSVL